MTPYSLLASLALWLLGCASPLGVRPPTASRGPDFALADLSGKTLRLSDYRGRPVLLDFWATWCGPCIQSVPHYERLSRERAAAGLAVVGVDEDDEPGSVGPFAAKQGMTYPVLLDRRHAVYDAYGVRELPTALLIDAGGNVRGRWSGFDEAVAAEIDRSVDDILTKKSP